MSNVRSNRFRKGLVCAALATTMAIAGAGTAFASTNVASSSTAADTPSTLLTTSAVRAGSAGPDFVGITNTNYDFQPSHTAGLGDPYPYSNGSKGWGHDLDKADQFNRLAVWCTGVNEKANPYYQNLLVNYLLDKADDGTVNSSAGLAAGYTMATTYHSNKDTSAWGDVTVDNVYANGIISQDLVFGANKYTNWNGDYSAYTQTALKNTDATYTNNDSTNVWTQIYTIEKLAKAADNAVAEANAGGINESLRYGDAVDSAVDYEKAIKGQMLYVASQEDAADGTTDGIISAAKQKKVAYLYAIQDGVGYFFVPGTDTNGSTAGNSTTATGKDTADGDYVSNNSTINMGYMATLPFVTKTFDSGKAVEGGIVMKVEDIWKSNPACTVASNDDNAASILADVDVIIYNTGSYTGYKAADETGSKGDTMAGTNNGRNSSGVYNTAALNDTVVSNWADDFGFTVGATDSTGAGTKMVIAGDDYGTSTKQQGSDYAPILYCARNYTVDKNTRAAWAWSKVFPEYYGNNNDATYAYWLETVYHIAVNNGDQTILSDVVAQMTHQDANQVAIYENNATTISANAEAGYAWFQSYGKTGYAADYLYYTGATRSSWYAASSSALVTAASQSGGSMTETEAAAKSAELVTADVYGTADGNISASTVGIMAPSSAWTDSHETYSVTIGDAVITTDDITKYGVEMTLTGKNAYTTKFAKLSELLQVKGANVPETFCHINLYASDGGGLAYSKWYPTQKQYAADEIYLYNTTDDNGNITGIRTATNNGSGKEWCKYLNRIAFVTDHTYAKGVCTYCGAAEPLTSVSVECPAVDFGTTATVTAKAGTFTSGVTYKLCYGSDEAGWTVFGQSSNGTFTLNANALNRGRTFKVTATSGSETVSSETFTIAVNPLAVTASCPAVDAGANATVTAKATGTTAAVTYKLCYGSDEDGWTVFAKSSDGSFTLNANALNRGRTFKVTATSGSETVSSETFQIAVK